MWDTGALMSFTLRDLFKSAQFESLYIYVNYCIQTIDKTTY